MEVGLIPAPVSAVLGPQGLNAIDWAAPWLQSWRAIGEATAHAVLAGQAQPEALNQAAQQHRRTHLVGLARFVPQVELPRGKAYESYIFESRQCPTREGLHDFFNGLAWLHFPQTKARLNQLHAAQIAATGIARVRGPARDALTLFDENAALLRAPDDLWNALVTKDWVQVFGSLRPLWAQSYLVLFGHALLEKMVVPRKSATAHVYRVLCASDSIACVDAWLANDLRAERLAAKPFAHLPVLGVPGWSVANEDPGFYADPDVFRAPRAVRPSVSK